jgi:enoyl-CoA hydratase
MEPDILLRERRDRVGTLVLNRPDKRNSLSIDLLVQIHLALQEWAADSEIRTLVITGAGEKAFSAGFDILSIPTNLTPEMQRILETSNPLELALSSVRSFPYPTIAMLNGHAFGAGLNLALCCDIRMAADDIRLGMPPAKLGAVYHPEGLRQFAEVLGMARTRQIFFTGRTYEAAEAKEMGMVDRLVSRLDLASATYALADEIAANAPLALKGTKRILNRIGSHMGLSDAEMSEAREIINEAFNSEDLREGQVAFLEKRKPHFKGR